MLLGNKIRSLRDEQGILQRQVAAYLEIDTPCSARLNVVTGAQREVKCFNWQNSFMLMRKNCSSCGWQIESWMQSRAKKNYSFMQ